VKDQHFCELEDDLEDLQECTVDLSALAEAAVKPLERELEDLQTVRPTLKVSSSGGSTTDRQDQVG